VKRIAIVVLAIVAGPVLLVMSLAGTMMSGQ
jgi:hypothetical protein